MSGGSEKPLSKRAKTQLRKQMQTATLSEVPPPDINRLTADASGLQQPPVGFGSLSGSALNILSTPSSVQRDHDDLSEFPTVQPTVNELQQSVAGPSHVFDAVQSSLPATAVDWQADASTVLQAVSTKTVFEQVGHQNIPLQPATCNPIFGESSTANNRSDIFRELCAQSFTPINPDIGPPLDFSQFLQPQLHMEKEMDLPSVDSVHNHGHEAEEECSGSEQDQDQNDASMPLYEGSPLTVHDFMVSILSYAQSAHLTGKSTAELLNLMEILLPKPNNVPKNSHLFKKYFETDDNEIQVFFFCSHCWKSRQSQHDICNDCKGPNRKVNYFISCSLESQLKRLYSRPGFADKLKYKYERKKKCEANIEDIYDGSVYKKAEQDFLQNGKNLSLTWYADGISIYECSTYSVWLEMFIINELPPEERHKPENVLIGGLWGGDGKPHPNIFLVPTYHEIKKLNAGVTVKQFNSNVEDVVSVYLICGTCDVPAKADFMCLKSHSGFFSCPKCFIKGEKTDRSENVTVFPHEKDLELRDDENYKMCVEKGTLIKDGFKGVFGPSLLSFMFSSSFISGMTIDVMHSAYMGITKQLLRLWFDSKYKGKGFSLHAYIAMINERLRALNLPHFVQRHLLDVDKNLSFWKASLCRTFLLYIVLLVFKDIMPEKYYLNLSKLVEGISLLNSSSISMSDLNTADKLLTEFCGEFEKLYGVRHMSHNIHLVRHFKDCVLECGNLFVNSCFRFEDLNGKLAGLAHGTRHAIKQISSSLKLVTELPLLIKTVPSDIAKQYCFKLTRRSKNFKLNEKVENLNAHVVGDFTDLSSHRAQVSEFVTVLYGKPASFRFFDRLFLKNQLYVSSSYQRGSRVSCFCRYQIDKTYHGHILTFVKTATATGAGDQYFVLLERSLDFPAHNRYVKFLSCGDIDFIPVGNLMCVSYCLTVANEMYLIDPLNSLEYE